MRLSLAILLAATAASADPKPFKCSAKGGSQWHEVRSAHFLVDTDATGEKLAILVRTLENYEAQEMLLLMGGPADLPGRLRVVALSSFEEYKDVAPQGSVGFYSWSSNVYGPYIALPMLGFAANGETVAHELSHYISKFLFPAQPHWFAEGLAQWVQTIASNESINFTATGSHIERGSRVEYVAGMVPRNLLRDLASAEQVFGKDLLEWNGVIDSRAPWRYHVWSWLLYHWLWNNRSKEFSDYQQRLMNGEDPVAAWKAALADLDPGDPEAMAKLDETLRRYLAHGKFAVVRSHAQHEAAYQEMGPLAPADVHALMATIAPPGSFGSRTARQSLDMNEALSEDPLNPVALEMLHHLQPPVAAAALRKAAAARPRDARAQFLLGHLLLQDATQDPLPPLKAAVALDPDHGAAHTDLALALLREGKAKEAVPVANRGVDLAPWDGDAVDSLAQAAMAVGKCKEAIALEKRELWLLDEPAQERLRLRIAADEATCGAAKPAAPAVQASTPAAK
jgi:tetratricopeptide (TPR) repeat protein